jgi:hypothetical protein
MHGFSVRLSKCPMGCGYGSRPLFLEKTRCRLHGSPFSLPGFQNLACKESCSLLLSQKDTDQAVWLFLLPGSQNLACKESCSLLVFENYNRVGRWLGSLLLERFQTAFMSPVLLSLKHTLQTTWLSFSLAVKFLHAKSHALFFCFEVKGTHVHGCVVWMSK